MLLGLRAPLEITFDEGNSFTEASNFTQFTAAVASFSMLLYDSEFKGDSNFDKVSNWLESIEIQVKHGFKEELKSLVAAAKCL